MNKPWPLAITNYLLEIDYGALEQEYYGPFNTILTHVFPFTDHYAVSPQTHPNRREAVDYLIEFMLPINNRVIGGVKIKRQSDIDSDYARFGAHQQVLDRFRSIHDSLRIPELIMISAIGEYSRVYCYSRATRTSVPALGDACDRNQWNIDLETPQGRHQLNDVFDEIKQNAQAILQ